jgi:hypothetical protein
LPACTPHGVDPQWRFGDPDASEAVPTIFLPGGSPDPVSSGPVPRQAENRLDLTPRKVYPESRGAHRTSTASSGSCRDAVSLDASSPCIHSALHPPHFGLALHPTLEWDVTYGCQAP